MKIVVLAGGISTEREISVVSGTKVCEALRAKGHRAILLDVYFGLEGADVDEAFAEEYDIAAAAAYIRSFDSRVEASVSAGREFLVPGCLRCVKRQIWCLWLCMAKTVRMERYRRHLICLASITRGAVIWEARLRWIKGFRSRFSAKTGFRPRKVF